ncbi:MAG: hypothetical protein IRF6MM_02390 [Candidatus Midichloria mitochondrii]
MLPPIWRHVIVLARNTIMIFITQPTVTAEMRLWEILMGMVCLDIVVVGASPANGHAVPPTHQNPKKVTLLNLSPL